MCNIEQFVEYGGDHVAILVDAVHHFRMFFGRYFVFWIADELRISCNDIEWCAYLMADMFDKCCLHTVRLRGLLQCHTEFTVLLLDGFLIAAAHQMVVDDGYECQREHDADGKERCYEHLAVLVCHVFGTVIDRHLRIYFGHAVEEHVGIQRVATHFNLAKFIQSKVIAIHHLVDLDAQSRFVECFYLVVVGIDQLQS